jgi:hypothetical protein
MPGSPLDRAEHVALGRIGRIVRSLKSVDAHQRELTRRRAQLLVDLEEARREHEVARDHRRRAAS